MDGWEVACSQRFLGQQLVPHVLVIEWGTYWEVLRSWEYHLPERTNVSPRD